MFENKAMMGIFGIEMVGSNGWLEIINLMLG
jgi:hypothetical protein